jgi:hypothetical protein
MNALLCIVEAEVSKVVRTVSTGKVMTVFCEARYLILTPPMTSSYEIYADL